MIIIRTLIGCGLLLKICCLVYVITTLWLPTIAVRAPVHIVTGSAGCQEGRDHFKKNPSYWSAFRSQDFGYTRFKAFNHTHINIEQISVDQDGQVIDGFWLVKTNNTGSR